MAPQNPCKPAKNARLATTGLLHRFESGRRLAQECGGDPGAYDELMLETRPGVYFWQARHPEWLPDDGWEEVVTSYALDDGERLVVIDPLAPPPELQELASKRETAIVLTCQWHRRDAEQ